MQATYEERMGPGPAVHAGRLDPDRGQGLGVRLISLCIVFLRYCVFSFIEALRDFPNGNIRLVALHAEILRHYGIFVYFRAVLAHTRQGTTQTERSTSEAGTQSVEILMINRETQV